jgi:hypothetical protein
MNIPLEPDSVGMRLFDVASAEMEVRSRGVNLSRIQLSRDFIDRRIAMTVTDLIKTRTRGRIPDKCLFINEQKQPFPEILDTYSASEIERIEIFGRGAMIRIYTQDFVARNLTRIDELPPIIYVAGRVCW